MNPVTSSDRARAIARGLGNAFLTAEAWVPAAMVDSAATVVGGRRRWLGPLTREVLAAYPRPPRDRPRELAAFIAASGVLDRALARAAASGLPSIEGGPEAAAASGRLPTEGGPEAGAASGRLPTEDRPEAGAVSGRPLTEDGPEAAAVSGRPLTEDGPKAGGQPLRAERIPAAPVRMASRRPWPVPVIDDVGDLARLLRLDPAHLDWFADVKGLQRRASPGPLHHYRYTWTMPSSGRARLLEAPLPRLRTLQRTVLDQVLAWIPAHPAAHGFVPGRNALSGASMHAGAAVVISLDLASFFTSVGADRVYGVFRAAGYAQPVAHLLTGLCTTRTPVGVIASMPASSSRDGSQADARFRMRRLLASAHLPQGAPTSPALANLCVLGLDRRLTGLAAATGLTYTRYADDLSFSGDAGPGAAGRLVTAVEQIVRSENLAVQPSKTRVRRRFQRQEVTGIVVNEHPNLPRAEYDRLRAVLHNAARHGPASQNHEGHADFRAHLLGRIAWATHLNPGRSERLRAAFDQIAWPS